MEGNPHVESNPKMGTPPPTPAPPAVRRIVRGPVSTSTKQTTGYFTVQGIINEISLLENDWPKFALKELIDNSYDFLDDFYPSAEKQNRKIGVSVKIETDNPSISIVRIAVRNSNPDNIAVFEDLHEIFDFNKWFSTKRHQSRITAGALGDFLKRVLGMGYASWTSGDNPDEWFQDRQWLEPVTLRFNMQEDRMFVQVDRESSEITPIFEGPIQYDAATDFTEVEVALPVPMAWKGLHAGLLHDLERYYKIQKLTKSRTEFSFIGIEEFPRPRYKEPNRKGEGGNNN
jgi:hypothetical protein